MGFHFIFGLPRSGCTLLAAILRKHLGLHAGMSSPRASLSVSLCNGGRIATVICIQIKLTDRDRCRCRRIASPIGIY